MQKLNLGLAFGDSHIDPATDPRMEYIPAPLGRLHNPIPHSAMWDIVQTQLHNSGIDITQSLHALDATGARYFGIAQVADSNSDFSSVLGWRFAHDSRFGAKFAGGSGVFVCSNLCMWGEMTLKTKHTKNILQRLPIGIGTALEQIGFHNDKQAESFDNFKRAKLPMRTSNAAITEMIRRDVISPSMAGRVIKEYDEPSHDEHKEDGFTVWRLFNAVTECYKPIKESNGYIGTLNNRSPRLMSTCKELAESVL